MGRHSVTVPEVRLIHAVQHEIGEGDLVYEVTLPIRASADKPRGRKPRRDQSVFPGQHRHRACSPSAGGGEGEEAAGCRVLPDDRCPAHKARESDSSNACPTVLPETVKAAFTKENDVVADFGVKYVDPVLNMADRKLFPHPDVHSVPRSCRVLG